MNICRGLLRIWIVFSMIWVLFIGWVQGWPRLPDFHVQENPFATYAAPYDPRPSFQDWIDSVAGPPLTLLGLGFIGTVLIPPSLRRHRSR